MKIAYVILHPEMCGGVKVVFQHARLLHLQGHEVTILGCGPSPAWIRFAGQYIDYSSEKPVIARQDLVIATYFATVAIAESMDIGPVAHFCQGYEGDLAHLRGELSQIEAAYRRELPAIVVAPHLGQLLHERFGKRSRLAPPPADYSFRPALRFEPRRKPWIFIPGIFEAEVKGVRTALEAVISLRNSGQECRVVRCSTMPLTEEEKGILEPDLYLFRAQTKDVAGWLRHCDLMLFPSLAMEGFGLPLLEAMVSKVPAVASKIPATEFIAENQLMLVPAAEPEVFARQAALVLRDRCAWRTARSKGYRAARKFHPRTVAGQLAEALHWARDAASN